MDSERRDFALLFREKRNSVKCDGQNKEVVYKHPCFGLGYFLNLRAIHGVSKSLERGLGYSPRGKEQFCQSRGD